MSETQALMIVSNFSGFFSGNHFLEEASFFNASACFPLRGASFLGGWGFRKNREMEWGCPPCPPTGENPEELVIWWYYSGCLTGPSILRGGEWGGRGGEGGFRKNHEMEWGCPPCPPTGENPEGLVIWWYYSGCLTGPSILCGGRGGRTSSPYERGAIALRCKDNRMMRRAVKFRCKCESCFT